MRVGRHTVPAEDRLLDCVTRSLHAVLNDQARPPISFGTTWV
jgi:hypothetical protein